MKFSSILLSITLHLSLFMFLMTFLNTKSNQSIKIERNLSTLHFVENFYEKQKQDEIISNKESQIYRTKKDVSINNLRKKIQKNKSLSYKSKTIKDKDLELKKDIKKIKSFVPKIRKGSNKKKSVMNYDLYKKNTYMSVMPSFENYKNNKSDQKLYRCTETQQSIHNFNKKNQKNLRGNENITINALLGYNLYSYNPNFINISNLLKSEKILKKKHINISELLYQISKNNINCN